MYNQMQATKEVFKTNEFSVGRLSVDLCFCEVPPSLCLLCACGTESPAGATSGSSPSGKYEDLTKAGWVTS